MPQEVAGARAVRRREVDRAHVRHVEHAGVVAHRMVLVDLRTVVDRHVPAAEIDHPRAGGAMCGIERRLLQHGALSRYETKRRRSACSTSPRLSFVPERLGARDGCRARRCPFGGSPWGKQGQDPVSPRPLSRVRLRRVQSLLPERFRDYAFGGGAKTTSRRTLLHGHFGFYRPLAGKVGSGERGQREEGQSRLFAGGAALRGRIRKVDSDPTFSL